MPGSARKKTTSARKKTTAARRPRKPSSKLELLTVVEAVERDLKKIAERHPDVANSGLAATARALAKEIDDSDNSATSKSMCAKSLQDHLAQLRELAPTEEGRDGIDDIAAQRVARLKRAAG